MTGHHAPIYQALWKRPMALGAPKVWTHVWTGLALACVLIALFRGQLALMLGIVAVWAAGQCGMVLLTLWDPQWDDALMAHLSRRCPGSMES